MDIIEAARQLGKAIQEDERYKKYEAAKEANDKDEQLQGYIGEYNIIRMNMDSALNGETRDDEKVKKYNQDLRALYEKIMANESMINFNAAKQELDAVMAKVNDLIDLCIQGEDPATCEPAEGCTGSCSSCKGCH